MTSDATAQLVDWATAASAIRAALLTSTRAVPTAPVDQLSDYDVILVVDEIDPWVTDRGWLNDFGQVLVVYWDRMHPDPNFGIEVSGNVTQYADGLKIDFSLWPVKLLEQIVASQRLSAELDAGYRILLDKDGLTAKLPPPTYRAYLPKPPTEAEYQIWINDFLTDAPYVAKCLWRDELFPAKWCLDYDMKHVYLLKMLAWRVGVAHDWAVPVGSLGKELKKRLPPALWPAVELCFAGADLADNWTALDNTMTLFRQVAVAVGDALGYAYPYELHDRVAAYVAQIRQLPPPHDPVIQTAEGTGRAFVTYKQWRLNDGQHARDLFDLIQDAIIPHYRKLDPHVQLGLLHIADSHAYLTTQRWPDRAYRERVVATPRFEQWFAEYQPLLERWDQLVTFESEWEFEEAL